MKSQTLSNLFHAVSKLEHAVTQIAGHDVMTEEQAITLLRMITLATEGANFVLDARPARSMAADPALCVISHAEAMAMDDTAGFEPFATTIRSPL